jgi:hypothetical protein
MSKEEEYWNKMCDTAMALDLITPETVPFLPTHARKIRKRLTLAESMLTLVVDLDHAYHSGWDGITAARSNIAAAAKELIFGSDETAEKIYKMALSQYKSTKKSRPLSMRNELERIAEQLLEDWPDQALELSELAESIAK